MASEFLKRCSAFLAIWEMQIKAVLRLYLTPVSRMTAVRKTKGKFCGNMEKVILTPWELEHKPAQLWKSGWWLQTRISIRTVI